MLKKLGETIAAPPTEQPSGKRLEFISAKTSRRSRPGWQLGGVAASLVAIVFVGAAVVADDLKDGGSSQPPTIILQNAALAANVTNRPEPQSHQYIFTETVSSTPAQWQQPDGSIKTLPGTPVVAQIWISVDGKRDIASRQRPNHGDDWTEMIISSPCGRPLSLQASSRAENGTDGPLCVPYPAYIETLPTNPRAMLSWLYGDAPEHNLTATAPSPARSDPSEAQRDLAFENARDLLTGGRYLTTPQRAALFETLAMVPGATTVDQAHDGAGRPGIGVRLSGGDTLIFDPVTYAFLGTPTIGVLRQAAVGQLGQIPS